MDESTATKARVSSPTMPAVPAPPPERPPAAQPAEGARATFALLREALRGSRRDLTKQPIGQAIFLLAVPMIAEMIMESVFAVVDIFWVSKLGPDAVAAVGLTESMLVIIYALAMGLSMGAAAVVARRIGEGNPEGASRAAVQAIVIGLLLAAAVGSLGAWLAPHLLLVMGASPAVIAMGGGFTRTMLGGSVTVMLLFLINAAFRGAGDAAISMRTLWLANGINIVLGPFLIFGWGPFPRMGVMGAAVATTIGRGTGVLFQLRALARGRGRLGVRRAHLRIDRAVMRSILRISRSGIVQSLIGTASWVGLVRILSTFGSTALAGYTIAVRVVLFALLPSWGLANAAATLVGQNLGAGHPERAEVAVWRAARYNTVLLTLVGVLFVAGAHVIVGGFSPEAGVVAVGARALRIVGLGFPFYAVGMVMTQAFNGAGDTRTPTLINLFCFWLWEIPLAYVLAKPIGLGPTGVFIAIAVAFSTIAVVAGVLFHRGGWKRVKV
ncbi:MAG TPA: MATE family efflux transporter [Polyangia bacterium]|nr:MATE family efflux transporter [Polyangia bacterium]